MPNHVKMMMAAVTVMISSPAWAAAVRMDGGKPLSASLPGAWAAFADPQTGAMYTDTAGDFAIPVVLDTGASGMVLSDSHATNKGLFGSGLLGLNIPKTGENYLDFGIAGEEVFDVSRSTKLLLAPINFGLVGSRDIASFSDRGEYKFQIKQKDTTISGLPIPIDVLGSPVLNQHVLHVQPNNIAYTGQIPYIQFMNTHLLDALPGDIRDEDVYRVPVDYRNFVEGDPAVTVADNPVVPGVRIRDARGGETTSPHTMLFDSGGQITIITEQFAEEAGIDLVNERPIRHVGVVGAGTGQVQIPGYEIDELIIPLTGSDELIFEKVTIFVSPLPGGLDGTLGMPLFGPSLTQVGPTGPVDEIEGLFSNWFLDAFAEELVLVPIEKTKRTLPGDLDGSGAVDSIDLAIILNAWTRTVPPADPRADSTGDRLVNAFDLALVLNNWARTTAPSAAALPEPATMSVLLVGLSLASARRPRRS